jgi:transcriptional regulator with XRE-family HTH domain
MTKPKTRAPGEVLRELRIGRGLSIEKLARMVNLSYTFVQGLESGRFAGSLITRLRIADALNSSLGRIWPETLDELAEIEALERKDRRRTRAITTGDLGPDLKLTVAARRRQLVEGD